MLESRTYLQESCRILPGSCKILAGSMQDHVRFVQELCKKYSKIKQILARICQESVKNLARSCMLLLAGFVLLVQYACPGNNVWISSPMLYLVFLKGNPNI